MKDPQFTDTGIYVLGAKMSGEDRLGQLKINVSKPVTVQANGTSAQTTVTPSSASENEKN